jgi:hypothetical protein
MRPFLVISAPSIFAYNQTSVSNGGRIVSIDNHSLDRCSLIFGTPSWFARIARCGARRRPYPSATVEACAFACLIVSRTRGRFLAKSAKIARAFSEAVNR